MEYLKNLVKDIFVFIYALIKWLIMLFLSGWVMAFLLMIFIASLWYPLIVLSPMLTSFLDLFSAFGVFFKSFYNSLFVVFDKLFEAKYWEYPIL